MLSYNFFFQQRGARCVRLLCIYVCVRVPVYMCYDFQLTYRVSPYLEKSLLYLLDLSSMALTCPSGTDGSIRFDIWGREGSGFSSSSASVLSLVIRTMSISIVNILESVYLRTLETPPHKWISLDLLSCRTYATPFGRGRDWKA